MVFSISPSSLRGTERKFCATYTHLPSPTSFVMPNICLTPPPPVPSLVPTTTLALCCFFAMPWGSFPPPYVEYI
jgi:hypothetical protein